MSATMLAIGADGGKARPSQGFATTRRTDIKQSTDSGHPRLGSAFAEQDSLLHRAILRHCIALIIETALRDHLGKWSARFTRSQGGRT
jgi:hypothetical protein